MAFQITDDVLDYTARGEEWGKPLGNDLAQGKSTLPLVHALSHADEADHKSLLFHLNNGRSIDKVLPLIEKYDGLSYARDKARQYISLANDTIPDIARQETAPFFKKICDFVIEREH